MIKRSKKSISAEINKLVKQMKYKQAKTVYYMIKEFLNQEAINGFIGNDR